MPKAKAEPKAKRKPSAGSTELFNRNFVRDLIFLAEIFNEQLLEKNAVRGHKNMRMAFAPVLLHIARSGTRAIDIAEKTDLSKQAIGKTVRTLERMGYIHQEVSVQDGRNKYLKFTPKGVKLVEDTSAGVEEIVADLEQLIGERKTRELVNIVALLVDKLNKIETET
ncbi:MAG TPA: MarR family transcriptional regulator [Spongiibacteraceae bacterium]